MNVKENKYIFILGKAGRLYHFGSLGNEEWNMVCLLKEIWQDSVLLMAHIFMFLHLFISTTVIPRDDFLLLWEL